jgi:hypothetical protein
MVAPNKHTIYPEYLPRWAQSASLGAIDALFATTGTQRYLDLRGALLRAKADQRVPFYYKTDSHWNFLGASVAFDALEQRLSITNPKLNRIPDSSGQLRRIAVRQGGDLAHFLRLSDQLSDHEPVLRALIPVVETTQRDFTTRHILHQGGNPVVESPMTPLWVQSRGALNQRRVLWLRDSFGTAMSPLMAASFSDVLQLDIKAGFSSPAYFAHLVERFRPDYVFFTVVERDARADMFTAYPPPLPADMPPACC